MTEQLMSVPAISKVPDGSVLGESRGAEAGSALGEAAAGAERGGSIVMVLLVAVALVAALSAIMTFGGLAKRRAGLCTARLPRHRPSGDLADSRHRHELLCHAVFQCPV